MNKVQDPCPEMNLHVMINLLDEIRDLIELISTKLKYETLCDFHKGKTNAKKKVGRNKKASKTSRSKKYS